MLSSRFGVNLQEVRALFRDDLLRMFEAAAALHFAAKTSVCDLGRRRARACRFANLALGDAIANAHDHGTYIVDNENYSQE
jgi:hypothetical protein